VNILNIVLYNIPFSFSGRVGKSIFFSYVAIDKKLPQNGIVGKTMDSYLKKKFFFE